MKTRLFIATALTLASVTGGQAQSLDRAKLDQFFDRLAASNKAMGTLVIAKAGDVLYSRSIGYSQINGSDRKPLTSANRFRIGSITKTFTAVMIMQLAEESKLKLTDRLDRFFPQVANSGRITIEQILSHRSGIHDALLDPSLRPASNRDPVTKEELLDIVARGTPDFEPGTQHRYSNSGYFLLGLVVEQLTGKSYAEALEQLISARIGLRDTYTATGSIDVNKNESLTYFQLAGEWRQGPETHPSILFGGGQIISTPADMATFIQALFDLKLVSRESLAQMMTMRDGYGFGVESFKFAGETFYGHTGGGDNYGAWLAYQPDEKLAVAYVTNAKVYPVANIVRGAIDIYYSRPFQIPALESVDVPSELLDKYIGVYTSPEATVRFTITREGGTLYFRPGTQSAVPLEATAQNTFLVSGTVVLEFDAERSQMTLKRGGNQRIFTKER